MSSENSLWEAAPLRILYLTKDQNTSGSETWDVRSESYRHLAPNATEDDLSTVRFHEYLYTQSSLEDIHIQWKPVKSKGNKVHPQPRINVCTYTFDGKTLTKNKGEDDLKKWGFRR